MVYTLVGKSSASKRGGSRVGGFSLALGLVTWGVAFQGQSSSAETEHSVLATITVDVSQPRDMAVSPEGDFLYVSDDTQNAVREIDTATNRVLRTFDLDNDDDSNTLVNPRGIATSPDGEYLFVALYSSNELVIVDADLGVVAKRVAVGKNTLGVAILPDGSRVYVSNYVGNSVSVIDVGNIPNASVIQTVSLGSEIDPDEDEGPDSIKASPSGDAVFVADRGSSSEAIREIRVSDTAGADTLLSPGFGTADDAYGLVLSASGDTVYFAEDDLDAVVGYSLSNRSVRSFELGEADLNLIESARPRSLAISPDGVYLYAGLTRSNDEGEELDVVVIDIASQRIVQRLEIGAFVRFVVVSPDSSKIYVSFDDGDSTGVAVISRLLPTSETQQSNASQKGEAAGNPGIFLTVPGAVGESVWKESVIFGAYAVGKSSPYSVVLKPRSSAVGHTVLASGNVNAGGHLERALVLPRLSAGSYELVLSGRGVRGELLTLVNVFSVDGQGRFTLITPEAMQPRAR